MVMLIEMLAAVAVLMFAACGGNMRPPDPLPPEYVGAWSGSFSVVIGNDAPRTYVGSVVVDAVAPDTADAGHVVGLCPDGTGDVAIYGFNGTYRWDGELVCVGSWIGSCPAVELHYTSVVVESVDGRLVLHASGFADWCGERHPVETAFAGQIAPTGIHHM